MENNRIFGGTISLLSRVLDLRSRNHKVIATNIANADTPNYKAFQMHVDEALQRHSNRNGGLQLVRTRTGHLGDGPVQGSRLDITRDNSGEVTLRGDGNTVDIDRSMARLSENSLIYNAAAQIIQKRFQALLSAIQGGSGGK